MGRFSGLGSIRANNGGVFFKQGNYVVDIGAVKLIQARGGADTFIVETTVVESDNPERGPGSRPSQVIKFKQEILPTQMGDVKQFIAAALGIEDADAYVPENGEDLDAFWEGELDAAISEAQPLKGMRMRLSCTDVPLKKDPTKKFTKHMWAPMGEDK